MSRFLITLREYNRIYQVAHGVRRAFDGSEKGCVFFACYGAMVLNKHYKIPARPVAGAFALCVSDKQEVGSFGENRDGRIVASTDGFHMWVQTETHIIDFMAPIFPEAFAELNLTVPRKMFQRPIKSEARSWDAVTGLGDFFTLPDPELTETLVNNSLDRATTRDVLMVADEWFGDRRRTQVKAVEMRGSGGEIHPLTLPRTTAIGSW